MSEPFNWRLLMHVDNDVFLVKNGNIELIFLEFLVKQKYYENI